LTRDFLSYEALIFTGILEEYFKKIRQCMTEKDLSSGVAEVIEQVYQEIFWRISKKLAKTIKNKLSVFP